MSMNAKTKLLIAGVATFLGIFAGANITSAQAVFTTCNSVIINDYATLLNGNPTSVWLEWGTTLSFGNSTQRQVFNSNSNFSQLITGLAESTTYYYRMVNSNSYGTINGYTRSFRTSSCSALNPSADLTALSVNTNPATNV